ncbi:MAG: AI-2E family transporter [Planctomycetes bacterium]|nr:AI-2E family transporter [Planctomycetota bacterium]
MNLNLTTATRIGLNLSAMLGIAALFKLGSSIFIPLVLAVLMASILYPAVRFLHERIRLPWFFACLTILIAVVAIFLLVFIAFGIAIPRTIEGLPKQEEGPDGWKEQYKKIQRNLSQVIPYKVDEWLPPEPEAEKGVYGVIKTAFSNTNQASAVGKIAGILMEHLWQAILIMFITLFLLLEGQMLADKVRAIFGPSRETQGRVTTALAEMALAIRTYLVWRTIVNLGLAVVLGAVYNTAGLKYWYLWALLVAVLSYVPYLGTIAAGIPPVLDAMLFVDPLMAIGIGLFYVGVVTFEGYIIVPWVMGRSMDLNATTVLLACLFWQEIWGMAGLFLAMPIMAAIKAVCMQVEGWQGWGDLMSSGPAKPLELESDPEKARLAAIADAMADSDATVIMEHDRPKGGSPIMGDPKSDTY